MRAFVVFLLASSMLAGCSGNGPPPAATTPPANGGEDGNLTFSGAAAFALAREQVLRDDGSVRFRVPGTPGNDEAAALIAARLRDAGVLTRYHHFNATYDCRETPMHNVVGILPGRVGSEVIYVGAHYDSRPVAEKDPNESRRDDPIPGANDGGSGVGVLLELARAMGNHTRTNASIVFLFFDGEDGGNVGGAACTQWILGSRAFADSLAPADVAKARGMVLVDLVGDPGLRLPREGRSAEAQNRALGDRIWSVAGGLGYASTFVNATSFQIQDDHVPFIERGIPSVDLIDLRETGSAFPATHHTHDDDLDHLSAASLEKVGRTLERFLVEIDSAPDFRR